MSTESHIENQDRVSIICRTMGRSHLHQALRSIAEQDYPNIEIVLIDARGENALDVESSVGERPVNLVSNGQQLSRSAAANAGLSAATGTFIQFLDDDDWISPSHVSQLVAALSQDSETGLAYSSTQKTDAAGESLGYVFEEDFDPVLLMRDNYIPIHAALFDSALLQHGCRFDEAFDIYEDWDFWLQLNQHTKFKHIDSVTAFYREGGESDTAAVDVRQRYQADTDLGKARAALFNKWLPRWNGEQLNALIGQLDQSVRLVELDEQIHRELKRSAELQHEVEKRDMQINDAALEMRDLKSQLEQLKIHSQQQAAHVQELERRLNEIYGSLSWKLMGPVRRVGRAISTEKKADEQESDR